MRSLRIFRLGLSLILGSGAAHAANLTSPWTEVSQFDFEHPHRVFAQTDGREARLGEAVTLLNRQPRTEGNTNRAAALLDEVAAAAPDDDLGICAGYLRARVEEIYRTPPQLERAAQLYANLIRLGGAHLFAQQAAVRLTLLKLYPADDARPPAECVAEADALGAGLTHPAAVRDHALLVGRACLYYALPLARAQSHFERALAAGMLNPSNRADVLVTLGEIARELGDRDRAELAYRRYLDENPRADRSGAVRLRLNEMAVPAIPNNQPP